MLLHVGPPSVVAAHILVADSALKLMLTYGISNNAWICNGPRTVKL